MSMMRSIAAVGFVLLAPMMAALDVKKASSPIRVDAVLDEAAWIDATPIAISYEWFPGENIAAAVTTETLVTWDDANLYVAFRAHDPHPDRIRARFNDRDQAVSDDNVGFLIDPFNDDRRAYQFRINPLGVQADAINSDVEGTEDFDWDAIWDSAGRITSDGYVVEVSVPLQQLRIPSGQAQTWGFMAMRDWPRDVRHRFRSVVTDQNRNCLICNFADVTGFGASSSGQGVEVTPTLTATTARAETALLRRSDSSIEPGVSGRWAITSGTSLQATLNPDFSQVEADAAQLDVNRRFALSFPEKRPFFLEGSDFFETQLPLVFTRSIADPVAGLKLTGKSGPSSFGVLVARDRITNFLVPSDLSSFRTSTSDESTTAIVRYRRELGSSLTAGGLVSSRTGPGYSNTVLSGDSFARLTERDSLRIQVAGSRSDYPVQLGSDRVDGHALRARYSHSDRNWSWGANYTEYAPGFRADAGVIDQVGVRAASASASRRIRGSDKTWYSNLVLGIGADATQQFDGDWNEWGGDVTVEYQGPRQSYVFINLLAPNQEFFNGRVFHNLRQSIDTSIQATRDLRLGAFVQWGESIDFNSGNPANFVTWETTAAVDVGRRLHGELTWTQQTFRTEEGSRIFTVDIPQARVLYHFNRRSFLRAILQYRDLDRVTSSSQSLLSQLLFSYRLNAQTVLLAGYSDGDTATDRNQTVFAKVSYAWLF